MPRAKLKGAPIQAAEVADWLDESDHGVTPDDDGDTEPYWLGQAAALVHFLKPYAKGCPPRHAERAAIARAFDVVLGERHRRLNALRVTERWIRAGRAGGVDALMAELRRLAPEIPKLTVTRRHIDAMLGRNATGVRQGRTDIKATHAAGRKTAAPAVLARIALLSGAFGIAKPPTFSDDDVKREAAKFRAAREKPITKKKASGRAASKKPNRKERDR